MRALTLALALTSAFVASAAPAQAPSAALKQAVANPARSEANRARDQYRHPAETLAFFDLKPTDTVVELWPGGGWYTEILAPYLAERGKLIVASPTDKGLEGSKKRLAAKPELFGKVEAVNFPTLLGGSGVAPGSADAVLTFRNVHNWRMGYLQPEKQDYSVEAFREIYAMLKPGGVLGIEDHRLPEGASDERERSSGYIKVSTIRRLAEQAGFKFAGASEVNANKKDTADWEDGVWTLPPTYAKGETDRAKYQAIGESDRMTLKFVKPKG
ncbi:class I SAM-dependent methyltransferase [Sphingomonas sp. ID1715]|uniref:class I SAM-dependent methyltransferase n=1 Tax=Sphingomonas sp. ID1715 TaxID=1656898 RepID=UPI001487CA32|nr:class I SAM-dependent methyltransferase [Sphingomonas sp. ID1715]NNM76533.1 class I SAM-dependent methyltransferase [Sphingomonas sp. ID1715]